ALVPVPPDAAKAAHVTGPGWAWGLAALLGVSVLAAGGFGWWRRARAKAAWSPKVQGTGRLHG
ncbi:hypothetical protein, partial [Corallococcus sp. CA047B]|uniref:hypothetical protein n=1 Tax=Corallococcus sp. CA047B TaxID=2316729 RepID=UPI001F389EFD